MTKHLVRAAKARHDEVMKRATKALHEMTVAGDPVTFVSLARRAGVSTDFLYNTPALRSRITELRGQPPATSQSPKGEDDPSSTTAIRALSTRIKEQRRLHHQQVDDLQKALAVAHGENLQLRRRLAQLDD